MNITKASLTAFALSLSIYSASECRATLIASESIQVGSGAYTAGALSGSNLAITTGNSGFDSTRTWAGGTGGILASTSPISGLTHSGVTGTTQTGLVDMKMFFSGSALTRDSFRNLTAAPSVASSYFLSTLVRGNTLTSMTSGSAIAVGFGNGAATFSTGTVFSSATGVHVGLSNVGGTNFLSAFVGGTQFNLLALDSTTITTTYQIVAQLDVSASGNETISLWYAPSGATNLTIAMSATDVGSSSWATTADIRTLVFQTKNASGTSTTTAGYFDEIRFGTAFADVTALTVAVPEPSNAALLFGLGASLFCLRRRRRST